MMEKRECYVQLKQHRRQCMPRSAAESGVLEIGFQIRTIAVTQEAHFEDAPALADAAHLRGGNMLIYSTNFNQTNFPALSRKAHLKDAQALADAAQLRHILRHLLHCLRLVRQQLPLCSRGCETVRPSLRMCRQHRRRSKVAAASGTDQCSSGEDRALS